MALPQALSLRRKVFFPILLCFAALIGLSVSSIYWIQNRDIERETQRHLERISSAVEFNAHNLNTLLNIIESDPKIRKIAQSKAYNRLQSHLETAFQWVNTQAPIHSLHVYIPSSGVEIHIPAESPSSQPSFLKPSSSTQNTGFILSPEAKLQIQSTIQWKINEHTLAYIQTLEDLDALIEPYLSASLGTQWAYVLDQKPNESYIPPPFTYEMLAQNPEGILEVDGFSYAIASTPITSPDQTPLGRSFLIENIESSRSAAYNLIWIDCLIVGSIGFALLILLRSWFGRMETELQRAYNASEQARQMAQKANQAKTQFLANMSHELKTPINAISGMSELLQDSPLNSDQKAQVLDIHNASKQLFIKIEQVLDIAAIESSNVQVQATVFSLQTLLNELLNLFAPQAKAKNLQLKLGAIPNTYYQADAKHIRRILMHFLDNAIQFSTQGTITLGADIQDGPTPEKHRLKLYVQDQGPGISPQAQSAIFEHFSQADSSDTRTHQGLGLGLAICKGLADALGGKLDLETNPKKGACFSFSMTVPVEQPPESTKEQPATHTEQTILIVEDNPVNQRVASLMLKKLGFESEIASNGQEALDRMESQDYTTILMDLQMPVMDGWEACRSIRKKYPQKSIRIFALTAADALEAQPDKDSSIFDAWLTKPIDKARLAQLLE